MAGNRHLLAENPARKFYERLGGQPVYEKPVTIGGMLLLEVAYGWQDVQTLVEPTENSTPRGATAWANKPLQPTASSVRCAPLSAAAERRR